VVSLSALGPVRSHVLSPKGLPAAVKRFSSVIRDVATTGNSGSGVFDAQRKCLLGIMSRKISQVRTQKDSGIKTTIDTAKYFVPALTIAEFMPAQLRWRIKNDDARPEFTFDGLQQRRHRLRRHPFGCAGFANLARQDQEFAAPDSGLDHDTCEIRFVFQYAQQAFVGLNTQILSDP